MSEHDDVLKRRFIKQQRRFRHQRIEPSPCLVYRFRNKLCRELALEQFFVLERIMMLCKRHCAGIEPAVNHLRHTFHRFTAFRTGYRNFIDIRSVQFHCGRRRIAAHLRKFFPGTDGFHMTAVRALPYV